MSTAAPPTSDQRKAAQAVAQNLAHLERDRGRRYWGCQLSNFRCTTAPQKRAVANLVDYTANIVANAFTGMGVYLFGPCGTGKDHLAYAVARAFVVTTGKRCEVLDGMTLFQTLRSSFDGQASKTEAELIKTWQRASMLLLSDPLPPKGELSNYQASALYRIIDGRYAASLPTIVTANLNAGEADAKLGTPIADRLRHASLSINCNWPSYRASNRPKQATTPSQERT